MNQEKSVEDIRTGEGRKLRLKSIAAITFVLMLATVSCVSAEGVGTIRISPALPLMLSSPADFEIWVQPSADPTLNPHIFLVMTESCYNELSDSVPTTVTWSGISSPVNIAKGEWQVASDNSLKLPAGAPLKSGVGYTVASLKDHLGTTDPIYWVFRSFLDDQLTGTHQSFTVSLPSSSQRMLVYALGETSNPGGGLFNCRVPPTIPGFVVPEPTTIGAIATSCVALIGYAYLKRKR